MKKTLLLFVLFIMMLPQMQAQHFEPVWSGNPYNPMTFYINDAQIDGVDLEAGDEVAAFDANSCGGELCVGSIKLSGPIGNFVTFQVSQDDSDANAPQNGYVNGNDIIYRIWDSSEQKEILAITPNYTVNNPPNWVTNYQQGGDVSVELSSSSTAVTVAGSTGACSGSQATAPVVVYGLDGITSFNLQLDYDDGQLSNFSYTDVNPAFSGLSATASGGTVTISWSGTASSLNNDTLLKLNYTTSGSGSSCLNWDEANSTYNGGAVTANFADGDIFISQSPTISDVTVQNVTCNGGQDGSISVVASGSTNQLFYSIDGGNTFQTAFAFNNLPAGTYNLVVQDNLGCTTTYSGNPIEITEPDAITIDNVDATEPTCFGASDGQINVTASGGTGDLMYSIDGGVSWESDGNFTGLPADSYTIAVKDDNDCIEHYDNNPVILNNPPELVIDDVSSTNITGCYGDMTGEIHITASGGTGDIMYSIDGGSNWQTSGDFTALAAGDYNVKVKDANDCMTTYGSNPVTITQPDELVINEVDKVNITGCYGDMTGEIHIDASGGTSPLQYSIDGGTTWEGNGDFTGLDAGDYQVMVKDANDCDTAYANNPVTITQPDELVINEVDKVDNTTCYGYMTGEIHIDASGGTSPLQYSIDGGTTWENNGDFTGLDAGDYQVMVKDANNCETAYANNPVTITQPAELVINEVNTTDITGCYGDMTGEIQVDAVGGTGDIMYSIDNGANWQSSGSFTGLPAGDYDILVKDANDCMTAYGSNPVTITQPDELVITDVQANDASAYNADDGSITISASGGTGNLFYSIDGGNTYQSNSTFDPLEPGQYYIHVIDDNGCETIYSDNPVVISQPNQVQIDNVTVSNITGCYGDETGSIEIQASQGQQPYQYSIDSGATWQSGSLYENLPAGDYGVLVKDANDYIVPYANNPATITQPEELVITDVSKTDIMGCYGDMSGEIHITAEGGTGNKMYSIDGGATWQDNGGDYTGLGAGDYNVIVKDANDCETTYTSNPLTITQPDELVINTVNKTDVEGCYGDMTGEIQIDAAGGTGTLMYSINGGDTWDDESMFTDLGAGDYNVMVKDANDCMTTYTGNPVTITQPDELVINSVSKTDINGCYGDMTGEIHITATGGTGTLMYSIDGGNTWQDNGGDFTGLGADDYNVVVKDANECMTTYMNNPVTITQPEELVITDVSKTDVEECYGDMSGEIHITAEGGTGDKMYSIDGGATWQDNGGDYTGLGAGDYNVMVKDANDCETAYDENPVTITQPDELVINSVDKTDVEDCYGDMTGEIQIDASGGTGMIMYSIDGGSTWDDESMFVDLGAGDYNVMVKDANDCMTTYANNPVTITQPDELVINSVSKTNITGCYGDMTGEIHINATGGTGTIMYSIDGGDTWQDNGGDYTGLGADDYNVMVKDANDCMTTYMDNPVTITQPDELVITNVDAQDASEYDADDGVITITAEGGTGQIMYSIDDGNTWHANNTFEPLEPGDYNVQVKDENDCITVYADNPVVIDEPPQLAIEEVTHENVTGCYGNSNGSITISATGGSSTIFYSIDDGENWYENDGEFENLAAGDYNVKVKNEEDVIVTYENNPVTLTQPDEVIIDNVTSTNLTCYEGAGGTITVTAHGGTGDLMYSIDGGTTWEADGNFEGLSAGDYNVQVKDENECTTVYGDNPVTLTQPTEVVITDVTVTPITCYDAADGMIEVMAEGGTGSLMYSIDGGATWQDDNMFSDLGPGTFEIMVKDANDCQKAWAENPIELTNPEELVINDVEMQDPSCYGSYDGQVTITAEGGTGELMYSIDNGDTWQSENTFTDLTSGTYNIVVKDANDCMTFYMDNPIELTDPPELLIEEVEVSNVTCFGAGDGMIEITASGGTGALEYTVGDNEWQDEPTFTGLAPGTYTVMVEDENGCLVPYEGNPVTITQPEELMVTSVETTSLDCFGADNGTITITSEGGTGEHQYSVDGGDTWQGENTFDMLEPGDYEVAVKDANECVTFYADNPVTITEPPQVDITGVGFENITCYGAQDGMIEITAEGGTGELLYSIDGGDTWQSDGLFEDLAAGEYNIAVKDANDCMVMWEDNPLMIEEPDELLINSVESTDITCNVGSDGMITIMAEGGTGMIEYSIDDGDTWQSNGEFTGLAAGTYDVVVRDANDCQTVYADNPVELTEPEALTITSVETTNITCNGGSDGTITVMAEGGTGTIEYTINGGNSWQDNGEFTGLTAESYTVIVKDENDCQTTYSENPVELTEPEPVTVGITADPDTEVCAGQTVMLEATASVEADFTWEPTGQTGSTIEVDSTGIGYDSQEYMVTATDNDGCTATESITVQFVHCTGVNNPSDGQEVSIYPNPTEGEFNLVIKGIHSEINLNIYDAVGNLLIKKEVSPAKGNKYQESFDLSNQSKGVYYISIRSNEAKIVKKVVIEE